MAEHLSPAVCLLVGAAFIGGCVTASDSTALRISNVKQGLATVESPDRGAIYSEGTIFRVERNADCIVAGETVPCMRWAIAFDYEAKAEITTLTCSAVFDEPAEVTDASKSYGKVREFSGQMTLKGASGQAFWPGYVTVADDEPGSDRLTMACLFEGKEALRVEFAFLRQTLH